MVRRDAVPPQQQPIRVDQFPPEADDQAATVLSGMPVGDLQPRSEGDHGILEPDFLIESHHDLPAAVPQVGA